ncbi:hypothetical protein [Cohnella nanjingensis]|uniref:Uncharacterized protein n=1 Tax=Cohnella nanjingensis TaxID=1387779 RepID=A0A7X0RUX3_9BACL|nr:hypothetical protein [Cohnella nanjingensis]MBB6674147.1 hypothetical protein [Cohnella nanjingensis]
MTHWLRPLVLLAVSALTIVLLERLPALERHAQPNRSSAAVFAPLRVERLSNETLVDAMVAMPLAERLTRVGWDRGILTVDLALSSSGAAPKDLWKDTAELVRMSFANVSNVRQLLLRFYLETNEARTLLASADSRAADWPDGLAAAVKGDPDGRRPDWAVNLRLDWTPAGERWLGNFAN